MRIAILNWTNRRIGGTGSYISSLVPHLMRAGHDIALWHEVDVPSEFDVIPLPSPVQAWSAAELGVEPALAALATWQPHILYAHGLLDPAVERRTLKIAPSVFFAHNYYGTCISGSKTFTKPVVTPCPRKFGWQCLAHYYPRRCGGLNPITMVRHYRQQRDRLRLLSDYDAVLTHSTHMQDEYIHHGLKSSQVFNVKYGSDLQPQPSASDRHRDAREEPDRPWRLSFVGRMDPLKGGRELLEALPLVARRLGRRLDVTFAGDGPDRQAWEALAERTRTRDPHVAIEFPGWIDRRAVQALFAQSDLLVLPSLWPEPFALVGLEAAQHHLPVAAFAVGGIPDWLTSGVNGYLAPGNPPTVDGLVDAIAKCLEDPQVHARLREGAGRLSADFVFDAHVQLVLQVFREVSGVN